MRLSIVLCLFPETDGILVVALCVAILVESWEPRSSYYIVFLKDFMVYKVIFLVHYYFTIRSIEIYHPGVHVNFLTIH